MLYKRNEDTKVVRIQCRYHTEISNLVFNLLGLDLNNDQLLSLYFECIDKASEIEDVEDQKKMQGMAEEIYQRLVERR